jgi:Fe-S-cluster-containing hydrogenase component 2
MTAFSLSLLETMTTTTTMAAAVACLRKCRKRAVPACWVTAVPSDGGSSHYPRCYGCQNCLCGYSRSSVLWYAMAWTNRSRA